MISNEPKRTSLILFGFGWWSAALLRLWLLVFNADLRVSLVSLTHVLDRLLVLLRMLELDMVDGDRSAEERCRNGGMLFIVWSFCQTILFVRFPRAICLFANCGSVIVPNDHWFLRWNCSPLHCCRPMVFDFVLAWASRMLVQQVSMRIALNVYWVMVSRSLNIPEHRIFWFACLLQ